MITAVRRHWQTPVALARERVVFTAKTKFCFARIGGKQGSRVVQGASEHAVFIVEHSASRKECALKFDTLLSGECQSCGAQGSVGRETKKTMYSFGADTSRCFVARSCEDDAISTEEGTA